MFDLEESLRIVNSLNVNDIEHAGTILRTIRYGMYEDTLVPKIISFVNKQLSVAITRDKGFELLCKILPDCSTKIVHDNCSNWANFALSHHPNEPIRARRLQVLAELIATCCHVQEFHKTVVTSLLLKIVDSCIFIYPKSRNSWDALECLIKCLKHFPSTCIIYKKKIEAYILQYLDLPITVPVLAHAATCFHYLNQVGGSGSAGSIHIKNYSDSQEKLFNTLNSLYDDLFENLDEYSEQIGDRTNIHEFKKIPPSLSKNERLQIMGRRLRNVTAFIMKTLESSYAVKKCIKPEFVIQVIQRGLATHVHVGEQDLDNILLSVVIQKHQIDLLFLLKTVVNSLGQNFIRFSTIKLLLEYLTRTKNCGCFRWNSEYKVVIYEVLHYWILNSAEYLDSLTFDKIMKHVIDDITPLKSSLTLNVNSNTAYNKYGKNKHVENTQEHGKENMQIRKKEFKEAICYQALVTLELLLKKILLTIKENTCVILFETITKNLLNISVNIYDIPYTSKKCRVMLYKVLIAIFDQHHKSLDIGLAINILSMGQSGFDFEAANICSDGLSALEKICQPTHLSLHVGTESPVLENEEITNRDCLKRKYSEIGFVNTGASVAEPDDKRELNSPELQEIITETVSDGSEKSPDNQNGVKNPQKEEYSTDEYEMEELRVEVSSDHEEVDSALPEVAEMQTSEDFPLATESSDVNEEKITEGDEVDEEIPNKEKITEGDEVEEEIPLKKIKILQSIDIKDCTVENDGEDMLSSFVDEVL